MELLEAQRAVVECGGQAEPILHEVLLAGAVSTIHGIDLRHGDVALVDHHQIVFWEKVEQAVGPLPGLPPVKIA